MPKNKNKNIKKLSFSLLIGAAVTLIITVLIFLNPFNSSHLKLTNFLFTRNDPSKDIIIVAIDNTTVESSNEVGNLGRFSDWSRIYYAEVIEKLEKAGAKVIGIDLAFYNESKGVKEVTIKELFTKIYTLNTEEGAKVVFEEISKYFPSNDAHPDDKILADIINSYKNIILYAYTEALNDHGNILFEKKYSQLPLEIFSPQNSNIGFTKVLQDPDGIVRKLPLVYEDKETNLYYAFSYVIADIFKNGELDTNQIPLENNRLNINYFGLPYSFKQIPFTDIYFNKYHPEDFKDKIVLIGITSKLSAQDLMLIPTNEKTPAPGVEVHANAIQTILEGKFLRNNTVLEQIGIIALISFAGALALVYLNIWFGILFAILLGMAYFGAAQASYYNGVIINMVYPYIAILLTYFGSLIYKYFAELREKSYIENAFGRYLSPNVMHTVIDNPDTLHLGGAKKEVTVFFSDIANFTTESEKLTPENLVAQLNEYLSTMTNIIMQNEGTLDKYVGDAIVAYFGAPLEQPDHAKRACTTALQMRAALANLHDKWQKEGRPLLDFRAGINTGEVIVGNVGSEKRFDYTIMGDQVNLGSRLEGANKKYSTHIMISEMTRAKLGDDFVTRELDLIKVKGKNKIVRVYELLARKGVFSKTGEELLAAYNKAFSLYTARDFKAAYTAFQEALRVYPNDGPSNLYLQRCEILRDFPPAPDWDGVFAMKEK